MKSLVILILAIVLFGCENSGGQGYIALQVENARAPEGIDPADLSSLQGFQVVQEQSSEPSDPLVVTEFVVTITGEGIDPPITATADASATEIEVLGIPVGTGRSILIEAFNGEGTVIRRRQLDGITIVGGVTTPIKTSLNTIPFILNLREGNIVLAKNFKVVGFGEPAGSIRFEAESAEQSINMNESVGGAGLVVSPALSTGIFEFAPPVFLLGKQTVTVVDEATSESSSVTVTVLDVGDRPGRRFVPAGAVGPHLTVGGGYDGAREGHFPLVLDALANQSGDEEGEL